MVELQDNHQIVNSAQDASKPLRRNIMSRIPDRSVSPFKLDGPGKATLVLLALGADIAAAVLRMLTPSEIKLISSRLIAVRGLDRNAWTEVLKEFRDVSRLQPLLVSESEQFLERALNHHDESGRPINFRERYLPMIDQQMLDAVNQIDADLLYEHLKEEHPQIVATMLALLSSTKAAVLSSLFGDELRNELLLRVALLEYVHPMALEDINASLLAMTAEPVENRSRRGGIKTSASLINAFDEPLDEEALERIRLHEPELAHGVESARFVFEDLLHIQARSRETLVALVGADELALAMQSCSLALKRCLIEAMPTPLADAVREAMSLAQQVKTADSFAAQQRILAIGRNLHRRGEIRLKTV